MEQILNIFADLYQENTSICSININLWSSVDID